MQQLGIILFFVIFIGSQLFGHEPNVTYSVIEINEKETTVTIDFPWTVQHALKAYYPELEGKKVNDEEAGELFKVYVSQNFKIFQKTNRLAMIDFKFAPQEHGHNTVCILSYPSISWSDLIVQNKLLFNINDNQQNHHTIVFPGNMQASYSTNQRLPLFKIDPSQKEYQYAGQIRIAMWILVFGLSTFIFWTLLFPEYQLRNSIRYKI